MSDLSSKPSDRTLVIIPTYDEQDNLPLIVDRVRNAAPWYILVVGSSPDSTGGLAVELLLTTKTTFSHAPRRPGQRLCYWFKMGLEKAIPFLRNGC